MLLIFFGFAALAGYSAHFSYRQRDYPRAAVVALWCFGFSLATLVELRGLVTGAA